MANAVEKRFAYKVRQPFTAEFACERENAQSACLPMRPMRLSFNAPVARKLAQDIRLKGGDQTLVPRIDGPPDGDALVSGVSFAPPLSAQTQFLLELPSGFKDASGRGLANAQSFPLKVATGPMPPLAKFAAAPFGIVERFAEGPDGPALLPVTLRNVEAQLAVQGLQPGAAQGGKVSTLRPQSDAEIIAWQRKLQRYDDYSIDRKQALRDVKGALPEALDERDADRVQTRMLSLLAGQAGVKTLDIPQTPKGDPRPFEVVGIPLPPGFSVVEIASPLLGQSLLDGTPWQKARTMVRAHQRAGDQPGRAFQAGARERRGLGDHAGQGPARGRRAGARIELRRAPTGHGHHRRRWRGADRRPVQRAAGLRRRGRMAQRLLCLGARRGRAWPSPGATGSAASSPGASTCPPAARRAPTRWRTPSSTARCCARARRCR